MRSRVRLFITLAVFFAFLAPTVDAMAGGKGGKSSSDSASVRGYYRKDGTYVRPHTRSAPDGNPYNNYGFPGNYNPNTGAITPGDPDNYLERYYEKKSPLWLPKTDTDD